MQPGGEGGEAIVINFITVQGGGGVKKGQKPGYVLCALGRMDDKIVFITEPSYRNES